MTIRVFEVGLLVLLGVLLVAGAVLLWRKWTAAACVVVGAAAGMVGALIAGTFGVAVSSFDAFVFFAVVGQTEFTPLWHYSHANEAEAVADLLNCGVAVVGLAFGAVLGLGVYWMLLRRR